jgi:amidophosphoribosyltransferase
MCGVIGAINTEEDVAYSLYLGLYALQHRGQESAGIKTFDDKTDKPYSRRGAGLVKEVFKSEIAQLKGQYE